jgi:hypothetical protein
MTEVKIRSFMQLSFAHVSWCEWVKSVCVCVCVCVCVYTFIKEDAIIRGS